MAIAVLKSVTSHIGDTLLQIYTQTKTTASSSVVNKGTTTF